MGEADEADPISACFDYGAERAADGGLDADAPAVLLEAAMLLRTPMNLYEWSQTPMDWYAELSAAWQAYQDGKRQAQEIAQWREAQLARRRRQSG